MIKTIKRAYNLFKSKTRDIGISNKRSSKWHSLQKEFLLKNPICVICGSSEKLNVHHKKPFHLYPELELDENNLVTLCMSKKECHLLIGHLDSFKKFNPNIDSDIKNIKLHPEKREEILKKSLADYSESSKLSNSQ
jgi:hypothetical protein